MPVEMIWGAKTVTGGYTSTGMFRGNHSLNHTKYGVYTQIRRRDIEVVVTGIYSTYFTCECRTKSGVLTNGFFDFHLVGDNYP